MKEMKIMRVIGEIDDTYIDEAAPAEKPKALRFNAMSRYAGIAAAAVLAIGIGVLVVTRGNSIDTKDPAQTGEVTARIFSQPEETGMVQLGNPLEYYDTLEEAVKAAGFDITAPESFGKYTERCFCVINGEIIEISYSDSDGNSGPYIRKQKGTEDPSGDYNEYSEIKQVKVGGYDVTLKGNNGNVVLAIWTDGTCAYSATADESGIPQAEMEEIIKNIK